MDFPLYCHLFDILSFKGQYDREDHANIGFLLWKYYTRLVSCLLLIWPCGLFPIKSTFQTCNTGCQLYFCMLTDQTVLLEDSILNYKPMFYPGSMQWSNYDKPNTHFTLYSLIYILHTVCVTDVHRVLLQETLRSIYYLNHFTFRMKKNNDWRFRGLRQTGITRDCPLLVWVQHYLQRVEVRQ